MSAHLSRHHIEREKRRRQVVVRRRRTRFLAIFVVAILAATAYTVTSLAERSTAQVSPAELLVAEQRSPDGPVDPTGPTYPVFARLDDRNLSLPVAAMNVTIIAYNPLLDERGIPLTPNGTRVNGGLVSRALNSVFSSDSSIKYYVLDSATSSLGGIGSVDIGAPTGTPIVAPVSGVVTGVTEYLLYGKYSDVQIDIAPDGVSDATLSILFVDEPAVTIGQTIEAGKTQLGLIREPAGELGARIGELTHDSGAHIHIQVMRGAPQ